MLYALSRAWFFQLSLYDLEDSNDSTKCSVVCEKDHAEPTHTMARGSGFTSCSRVVVIKKDLRKYMTRLDSSVLVRPKHSNEHPEQL